MILPLLLQQLLLYSNIRLLFIIYQWIQRLFVSATTLISPEVTEETKAFPVWLHIY